MMLQKQISVFVENKRGRLAEITKVLGDNDIDMRALSIADTTDFGILRIIADKPDLAIKVLKDEGFAVSITEVITLLVDDKPGGLAAALEVFDAHDINIEYMYHLITKEADKAAIIMRVNKPAEVVEKLKDTSITLLSSQDMEKI